MTRDPAHRYGALLDQDWTAAVDWFAQLDPDRRADMMVCLAGDAGELEDAPGWIRAAAATLAGVALAEVALRRTRRESEATV